MIGQKHSPEYERWIHSAAWQKLRRTKLAQNPLCEDCLEHDKFVSATEVHHVYPVDNAMSRAEREKRIALEEAVAVQAQQIAEMKSKASYYDVVLKCKDAVNISVIAKDYGWSAQRMNEYLHQKGVQYKQADIWLLYQKHAGCGYTKTNTHVYEDTCGREHTKVHTKWTQKGRLFIYGLLKADGVYPQIEMEV